MNKASGGDGIPAKLFQILKDGAVKVPHSISQQIWKTQQWPQDWKMSVFIPIPKKVKGESCSVMSNSVRPHRWQPTKLPHPWDSPDKNTGVGCHFLLQCMKVKSESEGSQLCLTLRDPMDCSLPGSSVHGIFQARAVVWGAIAFSFMT